MHQKLVRNEKKTKPACKFWRQDDVRSDGNGNHFLCLPFRHSFCLSRSIYLQFIWESTLTAVRFWFTSIKASLPLDMPSIVAALHELWILLNTQLECVCCCCFEFLLEYPAVQRLWTDNYAYCEFDCWYLKLCHSGRF